MFADYLGVTNVIWLSGAPAEICEKVLGDGTDYHVDIAARFVNQDTVIYTWTDDETDPRYPYLVKHLEELTAAQDEQGKPLNLIPLETPRHGVFTTGDFVDFKTGIYQDAAFAPAKFTDASYINYLVANNVVLLPVFRVFSRCPWLLRCRTRPWVSSAYPMMMAPSEHGADASVHVTNVLHNRDLTINSTDPRLANQPGCRYLK